MALAPRFMDPQGDVEAQRRLLKKAATAFTFGPAANPRRGANANWDGVTRTQPQAPTVATQSAAASTAPGGTRPPFVNVNPAQTAPAPAASMSPVVQYRPPAVESMIAQANAAPATPPAVAPAPAPAPATTPAPAPGIPDINTAPKPISTAPVPFMTPAAGGTLMPSTPVTDSRLTGAAQAGPAPAAQGTNTFLRNSLGGVSSVPGAKFVAPDQLSPGEASVVAPPAKPAQPDGRPRTQQAFLNNVETATNAIGNAGYVANQGVNRFTKAQVETNAAGNARLRRGFMSPRERADTLTNERRASDRTFMGDKLTAAKDIEKTKAGAQVSVAEKEAEARKFPYGPDAKLSQKDADGNVVLAPGATVPPRGQFMKVRVPMTDADNNPIFDKNNKPIYTDTLVDPNAPDQQAPAQSNTAQDTEKSLRRTGAGGVVSRFLGNKYIGDDAAAVSKIELSKKYDDIVNSYVAKYGVAPDAARQAEIRRRLGM